MQSLCTHVNPTKSCIHRVVVEHRLLRIIAFKQARASTFSDVYGRDYLHRRFTCSAGAYGLRRAYARNLA